RVHPLDRADSDLTAQRRLDTLHGRGGTLHRGDARDVRGDRRAADLVTVHARTGVAPGGVDDHVHVAGADAVDDVERAFRLVLTGDLVDLLARNTVAAQHLCGSHGGHDVESQVGEGLDR